MTIYDFEKLVTGKILFYLTLSRENFVFGSIIIDYVDFHFGDNSYIKIHGDNGMVLYFGSNKLTQDQSLIFETFEEMELELKKRVNETIPNKLDLTKPGPTFTLI